MGKLTKHAEVLNQLHSLVKKQAEEVQKSVTGEPASQKPESVKEEHETTNKNNVGADNLAQSYHQSPSKDSAEPVAKTAETLGNEILNIIRKHADAQDAVTGEPATDKPESVKDEHETTNKNEVGADKNTPQTTGDQKPSSDKAEPAAEAKKASDEVSELASKVASYELGRQFCAALLKTASETVADEATLMKEAGRRDLDLLIAQAAQELDTEKVAETEKQAEAAGAAYFEEIVKQAALEEAAQENEALRSKVAELSQFAESVLSKEAQEKQAAESVEFQTKLAESVANIVLERLKTEAAK
jgi:hypothetical protein